MTTLRTNANWLDTLLCIVVAVLAGITTKSVGMGIISGLLCAIVIGVWRVVRFVGVLVEQGQADEYES